jgi:hypothetical protein
MLRSIRPKRAIQRGFGPRVHEGRVNHSGESKETSCYTVACSRLTRTTRAVQMSLKLAIGVTEAEVSRVIWENSP